MACSGIFLRTVNQDMRAVKMHHAHHDEVHHRRLSTARSSKTKIDQSVLNSENIVELSHMQVLCLRQSVLIQIIKLRLHAVQFHQSHYIHLLCVLNAPHHGIAALLHEQLVGIFGTVHVVLALVVLPSVSPVNKLHACLTKICSHLVASLNTGVVGVSCINDCGMGKVVLVFVKTSQIALCAVWQTHHCIITTFHACRCIHHPLCDKYLRRTYATVHIIGNLFADLLKEKLLFGF